MTGKEMKVDYSSESHRKVKINSSVKPYSVHLTRHILQRNYKGHAVTRIVEVVRK
jgi:hypothetical protein